MLDFEKVHVAAWAGLVCGMLMPSACCRPPPPPPAVARFDISFLHDLRCRDVTEAVLEPIRVQTEPSLVTPRLELFCAPKSVRACLLQE